MLLNRSSSRQRGRFSSYKRSSLDRHHLTVESLNPHIRSFKTIRGYVQFALKQLDDIHQLVGPGDLGGGVVRRRRR